MLKKIFVFVGLLLCGCAGNNWTPPTDFVFNPIRAGEYEIATWQKIKNPNDSRIHIYIEGDGHAFDAYGRPTDNPTPHGTFVRDLAEQDDFANVVYMARPCQFIMGENCSESDWTIGRFSQKIIDAQKNAISKVAKNKKIVLIGYSGGAMVSGLIIAQNKKLNIEQWITVAGVLNHKKWTEYFGDAPLTESLDLDKLPHVKQTHFVGLRDKVVPYELAKGWADAENIKTVPNATHDDFGNLKIFD